MTKYQIIQTSHFKRPLKDFLDTTSPEDKKHFVRFQEIFDIDPLDNCIGTHDIYKDAKKKVVIYSSLITMKIRLIRLLKGNVIILLYKVMTDHDYNKIQKLFPMMVRLADMIE